MIQKLIAITKVGENKGAPRLWFESSRLADLGFGPHSRIELRNLSSGLGLRLKSCEIGSRKVSSKRGIPVIDLNSHSALGYFGVGEAVKVVSHFGSIDITPSVRTFHIREAKAAVQKYRVLELFAGGGTIHDALDGLDCYSVCGALELESRYLNTYRDQPKSPFSSGRGCKAWACI